MSSRNKRKNNLDLDQNALRENLMVNKRRELVKKTGENNSTNSTTDMLPVITQIDYYSNRVTTLNNNNIKGAGKNYNSSNDETPCNNLNGSFELFLMPDLKRDIPEEILGYTLEKGAFYLLVSWKQRSDGLYPNPEYVSSDYLKLNYPGILIDFYAARVKFVNK